MDDCESSFCTDEIQSMVENYYKYIMETKIQKKEKCRYYTEDMYKVGLGW